MTTVAVQGTTPPRAELVARGLAIEGFTIAWNVLHAGLAIAFGIEARSIAFTGFGVDSGIEVSAAVALFARLRAEARGRGVSGERGAMRVVAITFFLLSAYVVGDAAWTLGRRRAPEVSVVGVAAALLALVVMRLLARAKLRIGHDDRQRSARRGCKVHPRMRVVVGPCAGRRRSQCRVQVVVGGSPRRPTNGAVSDP